jgi:hypothetical protein
VVRLHSLSVILFDASADSISKVFISLRSIE